MQSKAQKSNSTYKPFAKLRPLTPQAVMDTPTKLTPDELRCKDCGIRFGGKGALRKHRFQKHKDLADPIFEPVLARVADLVEAAIDGTPTLPKVADVPLVSEPVPDELPAVTKERQRLQRVAYGLESESGEQRHWDYWQARAPRITCDRDKRSDY